MGPKIIQFSAPERSTYPLVALTFGAKKPQRKVERWNRTRGSETKMEEKHVKHCKVCAMKVPAVLDLTCRVLEGFRLSEIQQAYPEWLSLSKASISRHMAAV